MSGRPVDQARRTGPSPELPDGGVTAGWECAQGTPGSCRYPESRYAGRLVANPNRCQVSREPAASRPLDPLPGRSRASWERPARQIAPAGVDPTCKIRRHLRLAAIATVQPRHRQTYAEPSCRRACWPEQRHAGSSPPSKAVQASNRKWSACAVRPTARAHSDNPTNLLARTSSGAVILGIASAPRPLVRKICTNPRHIQPTNDRSELESPSIFALAHHHVIAAYHANGEVA